MLHSLTKTIEAWAAGSPTDSQSLLLDACMKQGVLSNALDDFTAAKPFLEEYRRLAEEISD